MEPSAADPAESWARAVDGRGAYSGGSAPPGPGGAADGAAALSEPNSDRVAGPARSLHGPRGDQRVSRDTASSAPLFMVLDSITNAAVHAWLYSGCHAAPATSVMASMSAAPTAG